MFQNLFDPFFVRVFWRIENPKSFLDPLIQFLAFFRFDYIRIIRIISCLIRHIMGSRSLVWLLVGAEAFKIGDHRFKNLHCVHIHRVQNVYVMFFQMLQYLIQRCVADGRVVGLAPPVVNDTF